jgi:cathepsin D
LAEKRLATYYGEIGIGYDPKDPGKSQMFKMLFDTGSCHFWVPGENCTTSRCLSHHKYQMTSDLVVIDGSGLEISYLSGKVEGYLGNETVLIGDIVVKRQTVGIADEVNIPLLDDVEWDGIVGLSYPNNKIKNQHVDPLFDNIIK